MSELENKIKTVVFCFPGKSFSGKFLQCWTELFAFCLKENIRPILSVSESNNIYYVRTKCLGGNILNGVNQKPFNGKLEYDYLMWIDSDQIFNVNHFKKLLSHDLDVVCGGYMMSDLKNMAIVEKMDNDYFKEHGHYEFLTQSKWDEKEKDGGLFEVDYCGMGFMLIKHGIVERLGYPWFMPELITIKIDDENPIVDFESEDVCFCKKIKALDVKIMVDPSVRVCHEKTVLI
jgi:hypothetical protein